MISTKDRQGAGDHEHILYELGPVLLVVKLEVVVAAKVDVEVLAGHELEEVRVEAHLVAGDGVEERRDALVEEGEDRGQVDDERAAESLDVVVLQDREYLARYRDGRVRAQRRALVVDDYHQRLLVRWHQVFCAFSVGQSRGSIEVVLLGARDDAQNVDEMS